MGPRRSSWPADAIRGLFARIAGDLTARALWSAIDAVAGPLASLALAAGLIRTLGLQDYGLIVVALAVSNLSSAINPAITATTTRFVAESVGLRQTGAQMAGIISGSLLAIAVIDVLLIAAALLFGGPLTRLTFGPEVVRAHSDAGTILLLAVMATCIQQIDGIFAATLKGLERFKYQAMAEMSARALVTATVISVAFFTQSVRAALQSYCYSYAVVVLVRALIVRAVTPNSRLFAKPHAADLRRLVGFGAWMWLNALATVAYGTVDRIVIGRVVGASAAAHFSIYTQLAQLVHFVPASLLAFSYPVFSRLSSESDPSPQRVATLYRQCLWASVAIGAAVAAAILLSRSEVVRVLAGRGFVRDDLTLVLLSLGYLLVTLNTAPFYLLLGLGQSRAVSLVTSGSMLAAIAGALVLIPILGERGAAVARYAYGLGLLALLFRSRRALSNREMACVASARHNCGRSRSDSEDPCAGG